MIRKHCIPARYPQSIDQQKNNSDRELCLQSSNCKLAIPAWTFCITVVFGTRSLMPLGYSCQKNTLLYVAFPWLPPSSRLFSRVPPFCWMMMPLPSAPLYPAPPHPMCGLLGCCCCFMGSAHSVLLYGQEKNGVAKLACFLVYKTVIVL